MAPSRVGWSCCFLVGGILVTVITLIVGENSYEVQQTLRQLTAEFDGTPEKIDGETLELRHLPDVLMGASLFASKRLVMIRDLSDNKELWDKLPDWIERMDDDIHLVLIEAKPDKRTKTYKTLQKNATVMEHKPWTDRDQAQAKQWVVAQAKMRGVTMTPALARLLVARVGVDQWQLAQATQKLSVYDDITEEVIREIIDARPSENVFELFETALKGDADRLRDLLTVLARTEDPYMLFGLLSGQAFQLMALAVAREDNDVAKDFGVHPYALSRLRPHVARRGSSGVRDIVLAFNQADETMKTTAIDPWLAIDQVLFQVAEGAKTK